MNQNGLDVSVNDYVSEDELELRRRFIQLEGDAPDALYFTASFTSWNLQTPKVYHDRGSSEHET